MTQYYFSQSVRIDGQIFKVGLGEVSEDIELHPHFLSYVKCGWITEPTEVQLRATRDILKPPGLNAKLFEKLSRKALDREPAAEAEQEEESPQKRGARTRKANAKKQSEE